MFAITTYKKKGDFDNMCAVCSLMVNKGEERKTWKQENDGNRPNTLSSYSASANSAWLSGTILRLLALLMPGLVAVLPLPLALPTGDGPLLMLPPPAFVRVGLAASRHLRKTLLRSRGMPSSTTVEMGTKGRSSMDEARMAYSWAKSRALRNEAYCGWAP